MQRETIRRKGQLPFHQFTRVADSHAGQWPGALAAGGAGNKCCRTGDLCTGMAAQQKQQQSRDNWSMTVHDLILCKITSRADQQKHITAKGANA